MKRLIWNSADGPAYRPLVIAENKRGELRVTRDKGRFVKLPGPRQRRQAENRLLEALYFGAHDPTQSRTD